MKIQRPGPGDIELIRQLMQLFGRAFDEKNIYGTKQPDDLYIHSLLGKEHIIPLVAVLEGRVAGGLIAYVLDKFEQERSEIYIYDLAVDEVFRRRGIATRLIQHLKILAGNSNAWVIYVQADKEDRPAITLYESLGCREDVFHFDIKL